MSEHREMRRRNLVTYCFIKLTMFTSFTKKKGLAVKKRIKPFYITYKSINNYNKKKQLFPNLSYNLFNAIAFYCSAPYKNSLLFLFSSCWRSSCLTVSLFLSFFNNNAFKNLNLLKKSCQQKKVINS